MAAKPKGALEKQVQAKVIAYLELYRKDFFWWRANTGGAQFGNSHVRFGLPGASDIQGLLAPSGRFVGIECKREFGGRVSEDQEIWGHNVVAAGGIYIVAPALEAVIEGLGPVGPPFNKRVKTRFIPR